MFGNFNFIPLKIQIFQELHDLENYLKGLPALIVQFSHLLSDPCRNVRYGHMDDVLQENGKVLQRDTNKTLTT